jgi:hypothetical protein
LFAILVSESCVSISTARERGVISQGLVLLHGSLALVSRTIGRANRDLDALGVAEHGHGHFDAGFAESPDAAKHVA